eukprot:2092217-Alexandrium_andersonii.AAC.1
MLKIRFGRRPAESIRSVRCATRFDRYSAYVSSINSLFGCRTLWSKPARGPNVSPRQLRTRCQMKV